MKLVQNWSLADLSTSVEIIFAYTLSTFRLRFTSLKVTRCQRFVCPLHYLIALCHTEYSANETEGARSIAKAFNGGRSLWRGT